MSYSVILRYADSGDNLVTLTKPTIHELKTKIPSLNILKQTHIVQFKDPDGCDIEDNDDLQTAFNEHGTHNLLIKVIIIEKNKNKTRGNNTRSRKSGLGPRSSSYTNKDSRRNDNNYQNNQRTKPGSRGNQYQANRYNNNNQNRNRNNNQNRPYNQYQANRNNQVNRYRNNNQNQNRPYNQYQANQGNQNNQMRYNNNNNRNNNRNNNNFNPNTANYNNRSRAGRSYNNNNNQGSMYNQNQNQNRNNQPYKPYKPKTPYKPKPANNKNNNVESKPYKPNNAQKQSSSPIKSWKALTILPYRWQRKKEDNQNDDINQEGKVQITQPGNNDVNVDSNWEWCSHSESKQYEQQFNSENKSLPNKFEALDSFRRIIRFEGKVIKILQKKTMGFVEPNYPQQNDGIGITFYYGDFTNEHINASNPLKKGFKLEYAVQFYSTPPKYAGYRAIDIKIISRDISDSPTLSIASAQSMPNISNSALNLNAAPSFAQPGQIASPPPVPVKLTRYVDRVQEVNKYKQRGLIWSTKLNTLLEFDLIACNEIDIAKDCYVEYCVENAKATKVTFVILDYKWREFDNNNKRWIKCSYQQCVDYENMYNQNHLNIESELNLNGKRLKRYTRFQGKIKRLNPDKRLGYVQYGVKYSVMFQADQCDFDASFLNAGDMISYEIERDEDVYGVPNLQCVNVKFLPIRYLWREKAMKGNDEWTNCSVQKSKQLENKYYQRKNKNIIEHATSTKYSRTVLFTGQISLYNDTIQFDLDDKYKNIKVGFNSQECKNQSFNEDDEVQFKLINTEQGVCKAIALAKPGESKRKCGIITRVDKNKKIGYLQPCDDNKENNNEYMFSFYDCNGVNPMFIPIGTRIEYELRFFNSTYKAIKLCLYLLPYQWLSYDSTNKMWKQQTIEISKQFEKTYNSSQKMNNLQLKIGDNMRVKKFQRKIKELKNNGGLVEINYNHESNNLYIYFDFKELQFDSKYLKRGDEIIYELRKQNYPKPQWKVVNIQFANIISFYWMTLSPFNINKRPQKNKWFSVPFRQNFDLERKYNSTNSVQFEKPINDTYSGKQYRRHTRFRGKMISLPTKNKPGKITVFYDKQFNNLLVDVDGKDEEFEKNAEYNFDIVANESGLPGFKAINMKERITYNKQIFVQSYRSKLIDVDIANKIGTLETPSQLLRLLNSNNNNKHIWYWQSLSDDSEDTPCAKELSDKLDTLKVGETFTSPDGVFSTVVTTKLSVGSAEQQNTFTKLTGFKRKLVKKQAVSASNEYLSFDFFQCKGFTATKVNKHCILEYNVMMNKKYKKNDEEDEKMQISPFKAVNVRIPMVFYRWQKYDDVSRKWKAESRHTSIQYEEKYNNDHKETDVVIVTDKKERIRRIIRFRGKILKIDKVSKRCQVRINYSKEYGRKIGLWFNFRDCKFNPNYLQIDDDVEYNLRGNIAVNIKLWLIPFKYIYKLDDNNDDDNWKEFTYHQCRELEEKFNSDHDDCKDFDYSLNDTLVTVRRIKTFKSKAIFDRRNRNTCYLTIIYCGNRNLGIRVPYTLKINNNIRHGNYVQFELKRHIQTRSWKIENIQKIKYENKQVLELKKQLEELKENMNKISNNTRIEYKWKWKDDDDSFNIYKPDISNKLNKQKIGQTFLFSTCSYKYTITKLSDDSGKQTNNSTQRDREIKRFTIRKTINDDDNTSDGEEFNFAIPDGEFYQNDYNKLIDDEIKQLFYATVIKSSFQIIDIEEVVIPKQNRLYELNLWSKCDELKKPRDEVEKYLWHGSSYDIINVIIQNGFDRSYSSNAAYGSGTYFARNARYSVNGYCSQHSDGYKYILLCKVIVGDSTIGSSSIKKVPLKSNQTEYDTLVDDTNNPSIYVVWRDYTAIPVFRIKFKST